MCFVFVFAALLEYAAVNYTYWGARAKKKKKEKKQKEKEEKEEALHVPQNANKKAENEDIIELHDLRMSPIPSIRNRFVKQPFKEDQNFPPSFRINRSFCAKNSKKGKLKVSNHLKKSTSAIRSFIPKIKDVNIIDKYSRVVFPVSFLLFNIAYWWFYKTAGNRDMNK